MTKYRIHRATRFPYISHISSGLRWRGERYIPKNVFFLREEVSIYDAPESATFPRMKGTVDRGIERELYFTEPPDFHIFLIYPPTSAGGESATFPRMFFLRE